MVCTLRAYVVLSAISLAGCAGGSPQSCKVGLVADLDLLEGRRQPAVEATLNDQKVAFLIDTGASTSAITEQAAKQFGLPYGLGNGGIMITGIGGTTLAPLASIRHLGLGHGIARDLSLPVAGNYGPPIDGVPVVGLFGADFMSNYDVDLDMPRHHFKMYRLVDCGSQMAPVDAPYFEVPFHTDATRITFDVKLNDKPIQAFLDSGAGHTMIPTWRARDIGVGQSELSSDIVTKSTGVDENKVNTFVHRFGSLQVGDETMQNFRFGVASMQVDDMIIGDDFLHFNEVWISYPLERLYIHPATDNPLVHQLP